MFPAHAFIFNSLINYPALFTNKIYNKNIFDRFPSDLNLMDMFEMYESRVNIPIMVTNHIDIDTKQFYMKSSFTQGFTIAFTSLRTRSMTSQLIVGTEKSDENEHKLNLATNSTNSHLKLFIHNNYHRKVSENTRN